MIELRNNVNRLYREGRKGDAVKLINLEYGDIAFYSYLADHHIATSPQILDEYKKKISQDIDEKKGDIEDLGHIVDIIINSNEPLWDYNDGCHPVSRFQVMDLATDLEEYSKSIVD